MRQCTFEIYKETFKTKVVLLQPEGAEEEEEEEEEEEKDFFSTKAYLTVSGQLHAESLAWLGKLSSLLH